MYALASVQYRFTLIGTTTLVFEKTSRTATFTGLEPSTQVGLACLRCLQLAFDA